MENKPGIDRSVYNKVRKAIANPGVSQETRKKLATRLAEEVGRVSNVDKDKVSAVKKRLLKDAPVSNDVKAVAGDLLGETDAAKFGKAIKKGKKFLSMLPALGALTTAFTSQDASAAIPILGSADPVGPAKGSLGADVESAQSDNEKRLEAMRQLQRQLNR